MLLLDSCASYWTPAITTGRLCQLLDGCDCYWTAVITTGRLCQLLDGCDCYWTAVTATGRPYVSLSLYWIGVFTECLLTSYSMQRLDACSNIANKVLTIPTSIKQLLYTKELDYDWVLVTSYHQCEDACIYHSYFNSCKGTHTIHSLIPRPRPAFHH